MPGGTYTWVFDIEVGLGDLFTGDLEASVKARYVKPNGAKVGALVSEGITLSVPEPAILLLLAADALVLRRKNALAATPRGTRARRPRAARRR